MERLEQSRIKGRGAVSNPSGRFEKHSRVAIDDGWDGDDEPEPSLRTVVTPEITKQIVSKNQSPDIPFSSSINPYKGCEHGCVYCFARPSHSYLGLSAGLDFETRIISKPRAAEALREYFERPGYDPEPIALGANTDPYQPTERKLEITRDLLKVFRDYRHPVSLVTKSSTVLRDLDLLEDLACDDLVQVYISVTTLDKELARRMEPRASSPGSRLKTLRVLGKAGIPTGVLASPMIPGLNDWELDRILEEAADVGVKSAGYILLRLPLEVKALFEGWLEANYPERSDKVLNLIRQTRGGSLYRSEFGTRMKGQGDYAAMLQRRFDLALRRFGMTQRGMQLNSHYFARPDKPGQQLGLFGSAY